MIAILHFTTLVIATMFAAAAAVFANWLLLRATFQLMRPAAAGRTVRTSARMQLVPGTVQVVRAFSARR